MQARNSLAVMVPDDSMVGTSGPGTISSAGSLMGVSSAGAVPEVSELVGTSGPGKISLVGKVVLLSSGKASECIRSVGTWAKVSVGIEEGSD